MRRISRRDTLQMAGATAMAALAGCQTGSTNELCGEEPSPTDSTIPTEPLGSIEPPSSAGAWPMYQHDSGRTGFTADTGPTDDVRLAWSHRISDDARYAWPVVADGTIVASCTEPGSVSVLSPADGSVRWSVSLEHASPPAIVEDAVIVGDSMGLHAFNLADGTERWTFPSGVAKTSNFDTAPAYTDDTILARSGQGVHAFETDGTERWRKQRMHLGAVADGIAFLLGEPGVVAVGVESGEERWSREGLGIGPELAVRDGTIYGGESDSLTAIDAASGETKWTFEGESEVFASPTVTPNAVFAASSPKESEDGGNLYALNRVTGDPAWCTYVGFKGVNAPAATDDTVFVPTENALEALGADSGDLQWRYGTPDEYTMFQATAVVNGLLVSGSEDGIVFAFAEA